MNVSQSKGTLEVSLTSETLCTAVLPDYGFIDKTNQINLV